MNLILAIVWFALGVGVLIWEFATGNSLGIHLLGNISPAWLAFLLCLYNLARWYSERAYRQDMQAIRAAQDHRRYHFRHDREPEPERKIDPNFDFTSTPPQQPPPGDAPGSRPNITDQPPSLN